MEKQEIGLKLFDHQLTHEGIIIKNIGTSAITPEKDFILQGEKSNNPNKTNNPLKTKRNAYLIANSSSFGELVGGSFDIFLFKIR